MKYYAISEEVLKSIIAYLMQKPYSEVAEGIQFLSNLPEIPVEPTDQQNPES